jgi:hypothetical protein
MKNSSSPVANIAKFTSDPRQTKSASGFKQSAGARLVESSNHHQQHFEVSCPQNKGSFGSTVEDDQHSCLQRQPECNIKEVSESPEPVAGTSIKSSPASSATCASSVVQLRSLSKAKCEL